MVAVTPPRVPHESSLPLSLEVFPPKTESSEQSMWNSLKVLGQFSPRFISCTYGAGGSSRDKTLEVCRSIQNRLGFAAKAHLTCIGSTREELTNWIQDATQSGVRMFMALRGDPPRGQTTFRKCEGGLSFAAELVTLIREVAPQAEIGVAGYPEKHPEAKDLHADIQHLKTKVGAGADAIYTQVFFKNHGFLRYRDHCRAVGIRVPIVPGVMPVTEFSQLQRIAGLCGASMPSDFCERMEGAKECAQSQFEIGIEYAIEQCSELIRQGIDGLHVYCLNRSKGAMELLEGIGLQAGSIAFSHCD